MRVAPGACRSRPRTRSSPRSPPDPGLLVPTLFDHYESFEPRPAAFFGVPVVRRPSPQVATVHGGGLVASGAAGADRLPTPWAPAGLRLTGLEGAGEVQTPLTGHAATLLKIGDLVWFRHAKSGEPFEARNDRAPAAGRLVRGLGPDVPRPRARVLTVDPAVTVLQLAESRPRTLGSGWLVCVDGPAGSGKTTLAGAVAALRPGSRVVHMDDLYDGWDGLPHVADQLAGLLRPLADGEPGCYRRYDWHAGGFAETVEVPPGDLLVLEGVGSGSRGHADLTTALVWVTAPEELRLRRGLERDGPALRDRWHQWMVDEARHFDRDRTPARADLVVDGTGLTPPRLRATP